MSVIQENLTQKLNELIAQTDLSVSDLQKQQLVGYVLLLDKWNKAYNLTSVRQPMDMLVRHIMDSIVVSPYLQGDRFIDVGTGPGLPGIPLAIMNPDSQFVLLDSLGKRIRFIKQVIHELNIENVEPIQSRVEEYDPQGGFDGVISRAFASISDMLSWCHHLPKEGTGRFFALKGLKPDDELEQIDSQFEVIQLDELLVPELEGHRHLVQMKLK